MHMYPLSAQPICSKRKQVKKACTKCQKACKKCDDGRPCLRCVKYGISEECVDSQRKERKKGIKRGPYKNRDGKGVLLPALQPFLWMDHSNFFLRSRRQHRRTRGVPTRGRACLKECSLLTHRGRTFNALCAHVWLLWFVWGEWGFLPTAAVSWV